jgi:hypothetical protein
MQVAGKRGRRGKLVNAAMPDILIFRYVEFRIKNVICPLFSKCMTLLLS